MFDEIDTMESQEVKNISIEEKIMHIDNLTKLVENDNQEVDKNIILKLEKENKFLKLQIKAITAIVNNKSI